MSFGLRLFIKSMAIVDAYWPDPNESGEPFNTNKGWLFDPSLIERMPRSNTFICGFMSGVWAAIDRPETRAVRPVSIFEGLVLPISSPVIFAME